jgi:succinate dehydrogenase / fumarate reductase membrane anchor subunit
MATASAIGRVKARGSAREGFGHWKLQRLTAIANLPLVMWFVLAAASLGGAGYEDARAWLAAPFNTTLMILLVVSVFWHAKLGVQVVIEDYIHGGAAKLAALVALNLVIVALLASSVVAILRVSLGS